VHREILVVTLVFDREFDVRGSVKHGGNSRCACLCLVESYDKARELDKLNEYL
jgi:hypothetical protein